MKKTNQSLVKVRARGRIRVRARASLMVKEEDEVEEFKSREWKLRFFPKKLIF